jgi:hypothetical protein
MAAGGLMWLIYGDWCFLVLLGDGFKIVCAQFKGWFNCFKYLNTRLRGSRPCQGWRAKGVVAESLCQFMSKPF